MSLRWKFALALGSLAAIAAVAASAAGYLATRDRLIGQIDRSLAASAQRAAVGAALGQSLADGRGPSNDPLAGLPQGPPPDGLGHPRNGDGPGPGGMGAGPDEGGGFGNRLAIVQTLDSKGNATPQSGIALPVSQADRVAAASGKPGRVMIREASVDGASIRIATAPIVGGGAVQIARRTGEANRTLDELRTELALITLAVIMIAVLIGLLLSRTATASLERLTQTAERVAQSGTPDATVTVTGNDEVGRLGRAFSQMLSALSHSRAQQQQLVEDAGHELRTPLTSLKTNIAVLDRFDRLGEPDRAALIADLRSETGELSSLVDELIELSLGADEEPEQEVDMKALVSGAAERAARRSQRVIEVDAADVTINGRPRMLDRAVTNLLENAVKFDQSGGTIELKLTAQQVEVSDRGPGIAEDQLEAVFDRFHRTIEARNVPGSGLGLAIVREAARRHGGDSFARRRDGGGAVVGFTFAVHPGQ